MEPNSIHRAVIETAPIGTEVVQVLGATTDQALMLRHVAAAAHDATANVHRDSPSGELHESAGRVRGVVLQGLYVLAELQAQAGRLEGLAAARMTVEQAEIEAESAEGRDPE